MHPTTFKTLQTRKHQSGAVLIIGLIMLLVLTLIGATSMGTSTLEEKMAGNTRDRTIAFQAAESALREAERIVQGSASTLTFDTGCTHGFCDCASTTTICAEYWTDSTLNVWSTSNRHIKYNTTINNVATQSKYIIESLGSFTAPSDPVCPTCSRNHYRITALGYGMTPSARVMLQSTYRTQ